MRIKLLVRIRNFARFFHPCQLLYISQSWLDIPSDSFTIIAFYDTHIHFVLWISYERRPTEPFKFLFYFTCSAKLGSFRRENSNTTVTTHLLLHNILLGRQEYVLYSWKKWFLKCNTLGRIHSNDMPFNYN